jgi:(S)-sulfolactate dehydrogenase
MATIVITEFMDEDAAREHLADFEVLFDLTLADDGDRLAAAVGDARALIVRNRTQVTDAVLAAAPKLECIGRLGVGLDNIDVEACKRRGIAVYPAIGANEVSVAEYVLGAMLVLMRGVYGATPAVAAGSWPRTKLVGREISGKRLGLVGFGANARETAKRALALGMTVSAFDPYVAKDDPAWSIAGGVAQMTLADLLAGSDVVSLHVPLTPQTKNLIDAQAIARMKPGAVLINAARGGIVDEDALVAALQRGHLSGAMLDVFAAEPLSAARGAVLGQCPNLILTPHVAGVTVESNARISRVTAENVRRHLTKA